VATCRFIGNAARAPAVEAGAATGHLGAEWSSLSVADRGSTEAAVLIATLDSLAAGVFHVDGDAQIVFANAAGRTMLAEGRFLVAAHGRLAAVNADANRRLRDALGAAQAAADPKAVLLMASTAERWIAHIQPLDVRWLGAQLLGFGMLRPAAMPESVIAAVLVREASLDWSKATQTVAEIFGLTASELRVLHAVLEIGGVRATTKVLGISEATVRTHLHHIFEKTGARRQVDLAKLVAGAAGPFRD
jgi:DNA-binding CsgD family transcriptional regulator